MKVIIVGCGRMGLGLAAELDRNNHEVCLIDSDAQRLDAVPDSYTGRKVVGIGFDQATLEKAGITNQDALVSCTNSDETNALIARIARNIFKVPTVVARLYDPRKATIYNALGIQTISTTSWGIQRAVELINYSKFDRTLSFGDGNVELIRIEVPATRVGRKVQDVSMIGDIQVVSIVRENTGFIPTQGTTLMEHDVLFVAVNTSAIGQLKSLMGMQ